jgi:hypothetical protein
MQTVKSNKLEVGDIVVIDWPRSRWDHRCGRLLELRDENGQQSYSFVLLDGMAVCFRLERVRKV